MDELQWAVSALDRAGAASLHRLAEPGGETARARRHFPADEIIY